MNLLLVILYMIKYLLSEPDTITASVVADHFDRLWSDYADDTAEVIMTLDLADVFG